MCLVADLGSTWVHSWYESAGMRMFLRCWPNSRQKYDFKISYFVQKVISLILICVWTLKLVAMYSMLFVLREFRRSCLLLSIIIVSSDIHMHRQPCFVLTETTFSYIPLFYAVFKKFLASCTFQSNYTFSNQHRQSDNYPMYDTNYLPRNFSECCAWRLISATVKQNHVEATVLHLSNASKKSRSMI